MKCPVINLDNKNAGDIDLDESVFGVPIRKDVLHSMVNWHLSKRRSGNHKTKQRSEIRGSTAKPFRQKGTGRARQGDKKSPHMRGGGVAFCPVVRNHSHKLPKKVRKLALKTALSAKQADGNLIIIDSTVTKTPKTGDLAKRLKKIGLISALIIDGTEVDSNFENAANNIKDLDVLPQVGANVYDILRRDKLVLTKDAVKMLQERLK